MSRGLEDKVMLAEFWPAYSNYARYKQRRARKPRRSAFPHWWH